MKYASADWLRSVGSVRAGPAGLTVERMAKVGTPLPLTAWVSDDAKFTTQSGLRPKDPGPAVTVRWSKYRGPGNVVFEKDGHPWMARKPNRDSAARRSPQQRSTSPATTSCISWRTITRARAAAVSNAAGQPLNSASRSGRRSGFRGRQDGGTGFSLSVPSRDSDIPFRVPAREGACSALKLHLPQDRVVALVAAQAFEDRVRFQAQNIRVAVVNRAVQIFKARSLSPSAVQI